MYPPLRFWSGEQIRMGGYMKFFFEKNFFCDFIPKIKMYARGNKNGAFQKLISLLISLQ